MYFYHTTGTYARDSYPVLRMYCVDKREILQWGYYKKNERFHVLNDWEDAIGGLILTFMYESLERPKAAFEEVAEFLSEIPTKPPEESTWAAWGGHLSVVSRMHPFFHLGELLFSNIYQRHQNGEPIDPNEFIELSNGYQHLQDYMQDLASECFNAEHTDENCLKRYIEQFSKQKTLFSKLVFCPEVVPAVYSRDFRFDPPKASDFVTSPVWKRYPCILEQVFYPTSPKEL